jgi:plastocyanin/mono/diheme cytochrome c family protein
MINPVQAIIGIVVLLATVGGLLYLFYARTNAVEKSGYGALIMLALITLMIPVFWIMESNGEAMATAQQHMTDVQRGAALYAQYCFQCHGTKGQGRVGPSLNNNPQVNKLSDNDLLRIISAGIYNTSTNQLDQAIMPAWSQDYGGPLTDLDIQYLFELIRSSDPDYLKAKGLPAGNGFDQVPALIQQSNPSAYQTAVAQESAGQFGNPVDLTAQKNVTINIVTAPAGATCSPACYDPIYIKVKVGTTITWVNKDSQAHTVTALQGEDLNNKQIAANIFDSGLNHPITTNGTFKYTVTMAAYNLNKDHKVYYYCQYHPSMVAVLLIVP